MHAFYARRAKTRIPSSLQIAAWHRVSGCGQLHHPDFGFRRYESLKTFKTFREKVIHSNQRVRRTFGVYSGEGGEFSGFLGVFAGRPGDSSGRWRSGYGSRSKHGLEHTRSPARLKPPSHVRVFGIIGGSIRADAAPAVGQAEAAPVNKLGHSSDPDAAQRQPI